jgi:hypothetical protein
VKTCRDVVEFLMDFLSSSLPADEQQRFEEHLGCCPPCIAYLKTYQETVELEKGCLCGEGLPLPPVPEELIRAILAARSKPEQQPPRVD